MRFNGFSKKGTKFLKDLEKNNTKEWFELNKHIWEDEIRSINEDFVIDMGETLQILVPTINYKAKVSGSLFKIYRDVRFSKNKTPMKDKIGLLFWQGNTHRMQSSSFYMHYTKNSYFIATGIRSFKPELLKKYREYLKESKHRIALHNILEDIKNKGYKLPELKYKKVPKVLTEQKDDKYIYLSLYNCMFAFDEFEVDKIFYSIDILDRCFNIYNDMKELQEWLYEMTIS